MTTVNETGVSGSASARAPIQSKRSDGPRAAAESVCSRNSVTVHIGGRRLELPPKDQLTFIAGLGVLAALDMMEWPVMLAIAIGHGIAHSHRGKALREFGEALEEA